MKKGFTLIELLAVIVILAIILVIAVPQVLKVVGNSKKDAFNSDAKIVLKDIGIEKLTNDTLDETSINATNIESILGISDDNYKEITITKSSDTVNIVIIGKNKWDGLVAYGTYDNMIVKELPIGLIGYWNFDGNANDSSGNNNNGTVNGATLTVDNKGRSNSAYAFDGTNDYIGIPYTATLTPTSQISYGLWVYKSDWSTPGLGKSFISKTEGGGYNCSFDSDGGSSYLACLVMRNGVYGILKTLYTVFSPGWHFIMNTYDGRYMKLYVDGVLKTTDDSGATYSIQYAFNNSLIIGAEASTGAVPSGNYFLGSLDDVRIYNKALSATEVQLLYDIKK